MELCSGGSLKFYLSRRLVTMPPMDVVLSMLQQISRGLQHLHACQVIHRDVRADNVLVASFNPIVVKLSDYGVSVALGETGDIAKTHTYTALVGPAAWQVRDVVTALIENVATALLAAVVVVCRVFAWRVSALACVCVGVCLRVVCLCCVSTCCVYDVSMPFLALVDVGSRRPRRLPLPAVGVVHGAPSPARRRTCTCLVVCSSRS